MNILHILPWDLARKAWPLAVLLTAAIVRADDTPPKPSFDESADKALQAMKKRAEELGIKGVAVIAFSPGEKVESWSSKMLMVGEMTHEPNAQHKGDNLLAIAYAKAGEMALTMKDSGAAGRSPMAGEVGWRGGKILKGKTGTLIAAFSGGKSEEDVQVSQAGLESLTASGW